MTDYSKLLSSKRMERGVFSRSQVESCLGIAERDLLAAQAMLPASPDWALNIVYNAMHQAGRALMFHEGFRTTGMGHHATVVRFLELAMGREHGETLSLLDHMRRKRNRATYDAPDTVSIDEARAAIPVAVEFVAEIRRRVGTPK